MFTVYREWAHFTFTTLAFPCLILHAEAGKQRSMRQLGHMLLSTVYNDKPQVAPVRHSPLHLSFITWLCLFSPCGPFSDWMNWKGWRFELNNTSYSCTPTPHPQKDSRLPLSFTQPIVSSAFLSAEGLSSLCGCVWKQKESQSGASLTSSMWG